MENVKTKLKAFLNNLTPKQKKLLVGGVAVVVLALIGGGVALAIALNKPAPTEEVAQEDVAAPTEFMYQLTGVKTAKESDTKRPVVSVKIENSPDARPQEGLESADIVWEELVEGGISRFVAMYNSKIPEDVGPVRSIRPQDTPIIAPFKGGLVFSGGKKKFINRADKAGLQLITESYDGFHRVSTKVAPHNLFYHLQSAFDLLDQDHNAPVGDWQDFSDEPENSTASIKGQPFNILTAKYSGGFITKWNWDQSVDNGTGAFMRTQTGNPSMSMAGTQHQAKNIIAFDVDVDILSNKDPAGTNVPEELLNGKNGNGYLLSNGKITPIKWNKGEHERARIRFYTPDDNKNIVLAPGPTWINIVPRSGGGLTVE